jgi:uncharacterized protein YqgC (DUF456 family)
MVPVAAALAIVLMLVGIAGAVLPGIPGTPLILAGAVIYAFATNWSPIGLPQLAILAALMALAEIAGYLSVALGTRRAGGSRWAIVGAIVGALAGMAFAPVGLLVGPLVGAIAGEMLRTGQLRGSVTTGIGAAIGMMVGAVLQVALALMMVGLFSYWVWRG